MVPQRVDNYIEALILEMRQRVDYNETYDTIYIGGGTPSILTLKQLQVLFKELNKIKLSAQYEFSFEGNVESFSEDKVAFLYQNRVNRLSVGMQTLNNRLLKIINREHTENSFIDFINYSKKIGFEKINVDLMFALPSQTIAEVEQDLVKIKNLNLDHVSIYSLILEENSVFYKNRDKYNFVSEEEEYKMYQLVLNKLKEYGFEHYEISNFCKNKKYSQHNLIYWDAKQYYGLGLGASGFINNLRYENTKNINNYITNVNKINEISKIVEVLSVSDLKAEFVLLGLRKIAGFSIGAYHQKFGSSVLIDFAKEIKFLQQNELIVVEYDIIKMSAKGLFVANDVFEKFI